MAENNLDDWDAQTAEYLNSGSYSGPAFTTGDGQTWGGNYNAPNLEQPKSPFGDLFSGMNSNPFGGDNYGFSPDPSLQTNKFIPEEYGQSYAPAGQFNMDAGTPEQSGFDWAKLGNSALNGLGNLFGGGQNGQGSGGSTSALLKGLAGLYAASQEKKSNNLMASQIPQMVQSNRQFAAPYDVSSPGAGMMYQGATTMRDAAQRQAATAQQALERFRSDPNSDAGYKSTVDQIENTLNRQAAMHGNRNNFNATAPAMLAAKAAAQMKYDQNYQTDRNSWDQRSGANVSPVQSAGLEALMSGLNYGAKNNAPYMDAIGKILNTNSYENNPQIQELIQAIRGK